MLSFNTQVTNPYQGYYPPAGSAPAPAPAPAPQPVQQSPAAYSGVGGISPLAALDLARIVKHPIQTIKSFALLTKDCFALQARRGMTTASAPTSMAEYKLARQHLDEAPFKNIFPLFEMVLDKWAFGRAQEMKPQVEAAVSQKAMHPLVVEWPQGGTGHEQLTEIMALNDTVAAATDGGTVRAFVGANRIQFKNSTAMDYFYPLAREWDAVIIRRNLPLVPGQKPIEESLKGLLNQTVEVKVQI